MTLDELKAAQEWRRDKCRNVSQLYATTVLALITIIEELCNDASDTQRVWQQEVITRNLKEL